MQTLWWIVTVSRPEPAPVVSVVIPTRNSAATLDATLTSVTAQSYAALEVIVVDGGSTDETCAIAQRHGTQFIPGQFGRSSARREGAARAAGKYLMFLDSDQEMTQGLVSECVNLCEVNHLQAVKIPESDAALGFWASCRNLDRRLAMSEDLSYPRFFTHQAYVNVGGHRRGIENFMEDRDLYLRVRGQGLPVGQCTRSLINHLGTISLLSLGLKGARSASDARQYFENAASPRESIAQSVVPRIRQAFVPGTLRFSDFPTLLLFPVYVIVAYGPRLVMVLTR